jgi:hypothetical protein
MFIDNNFLWIAVTRKGYPLKTRVAIVSDGSGCSQPSRRERFPALKRVETPGYFRAFLWDFDWKHTVSKAAVERRMPVE